jgi:hypothetical protein
VRKRVGGGGCSMVLEGVRKRVGEGWCHMVMKRSEKESRRRLVSYVYEREW